MKVSYYLPKLDNTQDEPFKPAKDDVLKAYCMDNATAIALKKEASNTTGTLTLTEPGAPASSSSSGGSSSSSGGAAASTATVVPVANLAKDKGGMAMQTGSATIGPTSWVDLAGMTSAVYVAGIGKASTAGVANVVGVYSDGYTLTSTLRFVANNTTVSGSINVCYNNGGTSANKGAWCHMLTVGTDALNLAANMHGLKHVTDTIMKTVTAGAAGKVPSAYAWPDVSATVKVNSPRLVATAALASAYPVTAACTGCLKMNAPTTAYVAPNLGFGQFQVTWYQPRVASDTKGPRLNKGDTVVATTINKALVTVQATGTLFTGAAALAAGLAGVATGAAALSI